MNAGRQRTALAIALVVAGTFSVAGRQARAPALEHHFDPLQISSLDPRASASQILGDEPTPPERPYGGADYVSYLRAARRLLDGGGFDWAYARLWPPGQPLLSAAVIGVSGEARYGQKMIGLAALFWSLALGVLVLLAAERGRAPLPVAMYATGFWFAAPGLAKFNFGFGAVMSEASSSALFLLGVVLLLQAWLLRRLRLAAGAGAAIGAAALLRPYFELTGLHLLLGLGLLACALAAWRARSLRPPRGALLAIGVSMLLAAGAGQAVTAPWRIYRSVEFGSGQLSNFDQLTSWAFSPDAELPRFHHSGNTACHVEPELCSFVQAHGAELRPSLKKKFVFMTLLSRPGRWLGYKLSFFDRLWFGRPWAELSFAEWLEGALLLLLGSGTLGYWLTRAWRRSAEPVELALLVASLGFIAANVLGFSLFQFEWRYSQALRAGAYFLPLLAVIARPVYISAAKSSAVS